MTITPTEPQYTYLRLPSLTPHPCQWMQSLFVGNLRNNVKIQQVYHTHSVLPEPHDVAPKHSLLTEDETRPLNALF